MSNDPKVLCELLGALNASLRRSINGGGILDGFYGTPSFNTSFRDFDFDSFSPTPNPNIRSWVDTIIEYKKDILRDYPLGIDCTHHCEKLRKEHIPDDALSHLLDIYICVYETCNDKFLDFVRDNLSSCHVIDRHNLTSSVPSPALDKLFPLDCFEVEVNGIDVIITNTSNGKVRTHRLFITSNDREIVLTKCFRYCVVAYTRTEPYVCYPYEKDDDNSSYLTAINSKCLCVSDTLTFVVSKDLLPLSSQKVSLIVTDFNTSYNASIGLTELVKTTKDKSEEITANDRIEIVGVDTTKSACVVNINGETYTWNYPVLDTHHYMIGS